MFDVTKRLYLCILWVPGGHLGVSMLGGNAAQLQARASVGELNELHGFLQAAHSLQPAPSCHHDMHLTMQTGALCQNRHLLSYLIPLC